jgi:cellobiose dehydrogenase (acceptor)
LYGVEYGFAFPTDADSAHSGEFIGQINAPISAKWVGITLGPGMNNNLLIVAWPNANNNGIVSSTRQAV